MTGVTDRQRSGMCWIISVLLHVGLLVFGAVLLIQPTRFRVEAGKTSAEMSLVIEPASIPAVDPPAIPYPRPEEQPILVPKLVESSVTPRFKPSDASTSPIVVVTKVQSPKPVTKPTITMPAKASLAFKGAVQAQPDELRNEPPAYPEESRAAREQGVVILQVEVTVEGNPTLVSILKSSGYFRLDQAAMQAVRHWKFHPAIMAGMPVSSDVDVPVHFKLQ